MSGATRRADRVTNTEEPSGDGLPDDEHFRPNGTIFILLLFVAALILLWLSVYVILVSRGVTV